MSKVMRSVKNVTKGYSTVQVKVREATSNDPWGPTGTQMSEIAQLTYNSSTEFYDIVDMIDKRLNDKGKNWRHVLKALKVLDYCLHEGSELIVTWARKNIYLIRTLREFQHVDEDGRDVGQNVRVAAKELSALLQDEERLRAERSDRKTWKSRVTGIEEFAPEGSLPPPSQRQQRPRRNSDEDDAEYKLALEASRYQEEEDRKRREGRGGGGGEDVDDDLAKAIKLSQEEEERRRKELEQSNANSLFDDDPFASTSQQPQPTGVNMGYQQGNNVDWFGNPTTAQSPIGMQPTGFNMNNQYTGYPNNGFQNNFASQPTGMYDPYGQQQNPQQLQQPQQQFPMQTGFNNPYAQQPQQPQQPQFNQQSTASLEPVTQPGSNNPWATGNNNMAPASIKPTPTGSNNPFASGFGRPQSQKAPTMPTMSNMQALPEQKTLQTFTPPPQPTFSQPPQPQQPQKEMSEHQAKLNSLLASGDGMDTFGNTGNLRIPAQHTAPGTFVNSAGAGINRVTADATGNNPFMRQQFTGMPTVSYGGQQMPAATGPANMGMNGGYGGQSNPFQQRPQQNSQQPGQDLIQF